MNRIPILPLVVVATAVLTACGSTASSTSNSPTAAAVVSATDAATPSASSCSLPSTPDLLVLSHVPGATDAVSTLGSADLVNCIPTLDSLKTSSANGPGDCTTVALASDNPGYDVNAAQPKPLKKVIEAVGPGC